MPRQRVRLSDLVITSGQTASNEISVTAGVNTKIALGTLVDFIVFGPATLPETVAVQISEIESPSASDWHTVYLGGADVTVPAAKAVIVPVGAAAALRLLAGSAVAADRTFHVRGQAYV
jgi:hypothetical protein